MPSNPTQPVDITDDWAATGVQTAPSSGALASGLVNPAVMGYQLFNWLLNFCTNGVRFFARNGCPTWDPLVTYTAGAVVNYLGKFYVAYAPVLGSNHVAYSKLRPEKIILWIGVVKLPPLASISFSANGSTTVAVARFSPARGM